MISTRVEQFQRCQTKKKIVEKEIMVYSVECGGDVEKTVA